METRANYALIGAFTLAVVVAAFGFVFWFRGGDKPNSRQDIRLIFSSSVSGLSRGSQVLFNGLRVGEVTVIDLKQDDPSQVYAIIQVDRRTPVKEDTRARLEFQGFTGIANVTLQGGSAGAQPLQGKDGDMPVIYAERSDFQNIVENVTNLSQKADGILDKADKLLSDNSSTVSDTLKNVQVFTKSLSDNSSGIQDFLAGAADLGRTIRPLSQQLTVLAGNVDSLVKAVDPAKVQGIVSDVSGFTEELRRNQANVDQVMVNAAQVSRDLTAATARINSLVDNTNTAVTALGKVAQAVDPQKVQSTVDSVTRLVGTLDQNRDAAGQIIRDANTFVGALARNQGNVDQVLGNAADVSRKLSNASDKIDSLVANADAVASGLANTVKAIDPQKIQTTVDSVSRFADTLDHNRDNTDQILRNASELVAGLNRSKATVDQILANTAQVTRDIGAVSGQFGTLVGSATDTFANVSQITKSIDAAKIQTTVDGVSRFAETLDRNRDNTDQIIRNANELVASLNRNTGALDQIFANTAQVTRDIGAVSGKFGTLVSSATDTFANVSQITKSIDAGKIQTTVDGVSRFAETLDRNRDNTDQIIRNTNQLTARLNDASTKLAGVLDAAQSFLGNANQQSLFSSITDAATSIKVLANNLDVRTRDIAEGLNRFTGPGLRQYEALATDGRRTLEEINRTVRSLGRNPSQVLFGPKSAIPEYSGR